MIGWGDVYKVVAAMAPLYAALGLGYGSVRWWRVLEPDHCQVINRFNCYFVLPFFTSHFTAAIDPYAMNFRFLAGDAVAKAIAGATLALWARFDSKGSFSWAITSFSLSSLNNTLVVEVPLLQSMYGVDGQDLVVQSSVIQSLLWFPLLLFMLEFRRATIYQCQSPLELSSIEIAMPSSIEIATPEDIAAPPVKDIADEARLNFGSTLKIVGRKLGKNPNSYACALGLIWALLSNRWHFKMPSILEGSIMIMAKGGSGVAMFSMGVFMAVQDRLIACGGRLTIYGMVLRFFGGPFTTAIGSLALGLRSHILCIAIVQAALPQSVSTFVYAQEYDLHANVLSTAVIFGTIVSLPLLIAYYIILDRFN